MGLDLFMQESNLNYVNKISGDSEVMDVIESYSDNKDFF